MLPTPVLPVKSSTRQLLTEQAVIWLSFGGLALLLWVTGADTAIARAIYMPDLSHAASRTSWFLRQYGTLPATVLTALGLIVLLWPNLWRKRPTLYKAAAVLALTTILGIGLVNQIVVKNIADRPRPRESVLMDIPTTQTDGFRGNSMPSGHAPMGFVLAAPFFVLRRSRPRVAKAFLATGLVWGSVIGISRMALGAHFATDILISGAIAFSTASLLAAFLMRRQRISPLLIGVGTLVLALTVILGNRFTNLTLTMPLAEPFKSINLPCPIEAIPTPGITSPTLTVSLSGYGAPLSNLKLKANEGVITLQASHGLYHNLSCVAIMAVPPVN